MKYRHILLIALLAVATPGCRSDRAPQSGDAATTTDTVPPDVGAMPHDTTYLPRTTTFDSLGTEGAVAVIRDYYDAIDHGDYERAYRCWGNGGKASGQTFEEFRAGFANTASVAVEIGTPGRIEGAAGSRYIEIPVRITAHTRDGKEQRFDGSYALRRSVVEGSTPAQRRWHFHSAKIVRKE